MISDVDNDSNHIDDCASTTSDHRVSSRSLQCQMSRSEDISLIFLDGTQEEEVRNNPKKLVFYFKKSPLIPISMKWSGLFNHRSGPTETYDLQVYPLDLELNRWPSLLTYRFWPWTSFLLSFVATSSFIRISLSVNFLLTGLKLTWKPKWVYDPINQRISALKH